MRELDRATCHRRLAAGGTLFRQGDSVEGLYLLIDGVMRLVQISSAGDERLIGLAIACEPVGDIAPRDGSTHPFAAIASNDCRVGFIEQSALLRVADRHPVLYRRMLESLSRRLQASTNTRMERDELTVAGQVAAVVVRLAEELGKSDPDGAIVVNHFLKQRDIASMIGAARENVNRVLAAMRRARHLDAGGGRFVIRDLDALRRMAAY